LSEDKQNKKEKVKHGLGKGLGALIPTVEFSKDKGFKLAPKVEEETTSEQGLAKLIDVDKIRKNPYQPRTEFDPDELENLKNSIITHGLISPIAVRYSINGYELISGERRLRAFTLAGLKKIPAYIINVKSDEEMLELAIIENVQRENLNPIEVAHGYNRLIEEYKYTQEQVAERVGKDRTTVTNFLRLLRLPETVQDMVRGKKISMGHARALLGINELSHIIATSKEIVEKGLSVRATESLVKDIELGKVKFSFDGKRIASQKEKKEVVEKDVALQLENIENRLRQQFGTNVRIIPKTKTTGIVEFEFYSIDDFDRLIELFEIEKDTND